MYVKLKLINGSEELTSIVIYEDQSSEEIRKIFMLKCDITDFRLILKLRNKRGSVVPFSYQSFEASSRDEPYTLEAVQPHATIPLSSRSVNNDATYSIEVYFLKQVLLIEKFLSLQHYYTITLFNSLSL